MLSLQHQDDRVPYTCTRCHHVTWAPGGRVAVTCGQCGLMDLGTELARQQWRTVAEIRMQNKPEVSLPAEPSQRLGYLWPVVAVVVAVGLFAMAGMLAGVLL